MRNRGPPLSTTNGPSLSEAGSFGGRGCGFSSSRSLHTQRTSRAQDGVEVTGAQPFERTLPTETACFSSAASSRVATVAIAADARSMNAPFSDASVGRRECTRAAAVLALIALGARLRWDFVGGRERVRFSRRRSSLAYLQPTQE